MKTMTELAAYFDIPYYIVYGALVDIKAYGKHNQKFDVEKARKRILERLERQKAQAMEKMAFCDGMIRRVQTAGGKDDGAEL